MIKQRSLTMDVNEARKWHLAVGEWFDSWRIVPRIIVAGYSYLVYIVVKWYMELTPYMIEGCVSQVVTDCIAQAPSTQHAALVTAVISIAAAIFGLYSSSGRKWENGFRKWNGDHPPKE